MLRHLLSLFAAFGTLAAASGAAALFTPPTMEQVRAAIGPLDDEPPVSRRLLSVDADFAPIPPPRPFDWLAAHDERGQSFAEFRMGDWYRPGPRHHILYLQPIGAFPSDAPPLAELRAYAQAFFQMRVELLPGVAVEDAKFTRRIHEGTGKEQLLTGSVRGFLKGRLPADAFCVLGITMTDLYPEPDWSYVFGDAAPAERVGVYSFARYDPAFIGQQRLAADAE